MEKTQKHPQEGLSWCSWFILQVQPARSQTLLNTKTAVFVQGARLCAGLPEPVQITFPQFHGISNTDTMQH